MSRRASIVARPAVVVVGGLLCTWMLAGWALSGGFVTRSFAASGDDRGAALLARARDASTRYDFTGEVVVSWRADGRMHRERVPVHEEKGVLRVGGARTIIGAGDDRLVARDGVWKRLWGDASGSGENGLAAVDPSRKYTLAVTDGPRIAGRRCTVIEAGRGGHVSERFAVDDATGLLLRREQLDARGRVTRSVGFVQLGDATPASTTPSKAKTPRAEGPAPKAIKKSPSADVAPSRLGRGFTLAGRYRGSDGSIQLFYSDGIYAVSVFEQQGDLDRRGLPDDASPTDFAGRELDSYEIPSGTVVVWADADRVYTLVSDAPKRDLDAIVHDLPAPAESDTASEMTRFVLAPFQW